MTKKASIISNLAIAGVLLVISLAVFTTDLTNVFVSVSAPVYSGNKDQKNVSFLISAADGSEHIDGITAALKEKGAGATFFVTGAWAMKYPNIVKDIVSKGFELGNMGYSGKSLKKLSAAAQKKEISATHEFIKSLTGINMKLFSPPGGSFSKTTLKAAEELGYTTIMWSKSFDKAAENLKNGDLVMMLPTPENVNTLPNIIDFYLSQGYAVVPVGENIA